VRWQYYFQQLSRRAISSIAKEADRLGYSGWELMFGTTNDDTAFLVYRRQDTSVNPFDEAEIAFQAGEEPSHENMSKEETGGDENAPADWEQE
jgi:hypothetical protein